VDILESMKLGFRRAFSKIPDPATFIESVPWSEFSDVIQMPESARTKYFATWSDADPTILLHQVFTEEEVFQYCVERRWEFPDQRVRGQWAVLLTPVQETEFVKELQNFWGTWVRFSR
jgi:hypothetical protein